MYDPERNAYFAMSSAESFDERWWNMAEPIWISALRRNRTVAMHWWDGCQVNFNGTRPKVCTPYRGYWSNVNRDTSMKLMEAIDAFKTGALDLAMFYYEGPDAMGECPAADSSIKRNRCSAKK